MKQVAGKLPCVRSDYRWFFFGRPSLQTGGEREDRGPNGDVGIEGNSGSDGKGEWNEMVWACVEEG